MVKKLYNFKFDEDLIAEIDRWRSCQEVAPSRTDVIKAAIERFVRSQKPEPVSPSKEKEATHV